MTLIAIKDFPSYKEKRIAIRVVKIQELRELLNTMTLPDTLASKINEELTKINLLEDKNEVFQQIGKSQARILKLMETELELVTLNHHRNIWLALGMAIFGLPLGLGLGLALGNMGFLGLGLPFGLVMGIVIGSALDSKAKKEGKQLDFEA